MHVAAAASLNYLCNVSIPRRDFLGMRVTVIISDKCCQTPRRSNPITRRNMSRETHRAIRASLRIFPLSAVTASSLNGTPHQNAYLKESEILAWRRVARRRGSDTSGAPDSKRHLGRQIRGFDASSLSAPPCRRSFVPGRHL